MKKTLKTIALVLAMLGTCANYAADNSSHPKKEKKDDLVTVKNASGKTIYSNQIEFKGNITSVFDFAHLEQGIYTVEVNRDFEIEVTSVKVSELDVVVLYNTELTIHKPVFRTEKTKLLISKIALDDKDMHVELYFENELIHSETVTGDEILKRVYQLDKNERGKYTAKIKSNGRTYIEHFKI